MIFVFERCPRRGEGGGEGEDKNERFEGTEGGRGREREEKIRRLENEMKIKDILGGEKTPAM